MYILGLEVAHKFFVNSAEKNLFEGLVDRVIFFEQCDGVSEIFAFVGNDGGGGASSGDCGGARVHRRVKSGGGEGVVDS